MASHNAQLPFMISTSLYKLYIENLAESPNPNHFVRFEFWSNANKNVYFCIETGVFSNHVSSLETII